MGDVLADGDRWSGYQSDAREMSRYVQAHLRTALLGDTRRWAVLPAVLLLHVMLWHGLVRLMGHDLALANVPSGAITVEFIAPAPTPEAPPIDVAPFRRSVAPPRTSTPPLAERAMPLPAVQEPAREDEDPPPRARLFRPDGSPNVAEDMLAQIERQPLGDGSMEYRIADLDRAGHFDSKPAIEYEETVFERYWIPSESLLEEWVRRGIKKVSIPIPGTNQRITCYISLVAPGAACGITRPRQMNERVEAEYQPPPNRNLRTH